MISDVNTRFVCRDHTLASWMGERLVTVGGALLSCAMGISALVSRAIVRCSLVRDALTDALNIRK